MKTIMPDKGNVQVIDQSIRDPIEKAKEATNDAIEAAKLAIIEAIDSAKRHANSALEKGQNAAKEALNKATDVTRISTKPPRHQGKSWIRRSRPPTKCWTRLRT